MMAWQNNEYMDSLDPAIKHVLHLTSEPLNVIHLVSSNISDEVDFCMCLLYIGLATTYKRLQAPGKMYFFTLDGIIDIWIIFYKSSLDFNFSKK